MSFLAVIHNKLSAEPDRPALIELTDDGPREVSGSTLLRMMGHTRSYLERQGVGAGDRVVLLGKNSADWVSVDLGILSSGATVVPLFDRLPPAEMAQVLEDAVPKLALVEHDSLAASVRSVWDGEVTTFAELHGAEPTFAPPAARAPASLVSIIYTSGTSGAPKGVMLSSRNFDFMVPQTVEALERVVDARRPGPPTADQDQEAVFHFLPFCFAASRLMLWTQLTRGQPMVLSADLAQLADELKTVSPTYFLTVPLVLERVQRAVVESVRQKGTWLCRWLDRALAAQRRLDEAHAGFGKALLDRALLLGLRPWLLSPIRKQIGPRLRFIISGSAPLSPETQAFFGMLGIPVLQAYGLTETTGVVSLDQPGKVRAGLVGVPLPGVEVRVGEQEELLVRGPNIFEGYFQKPEEKERADAGGWFRTGDRVELSGSHIRVTGRLKNLIVLASGHNVAPEPLEARFAELCPEAERAVVVGHGKAHLGVLVFGAIPQQAVQAALDRMNAGVASHRRIRAFSIVEGGLPAEGGLMTANQKLRRARVEAHFRSRMQTMYGRPVPHPAPVAHR